MLFLLLENFLRFYFFMYMSIDLNVCVHPMCMGAASRGQKNVIKSTGTVVINSCIPKCGTGI